jgi:Domain of unknown function (DUF4173)
MSFFTQIEQNLKPKLRQIILVIAIALPLLSVNEYYFNFVGVGVSGIILAIFTFLSKKTKATFDYILTAAAVLMATNLFLKSNPIVIFFSFIAYIYTFSWLTTAIPNSKFGKILYFFVPYFLNFGKIIDTPDTLPKLGYINRLNIFQTQTTDPLDNPNETKEFRANFYWVNILVTVVVLCIIIPLLSYSNPYFGKIVNEITTNLYNTFKDILSFWTVIRITIGLSLYWFLPRLFCYLNTHFAVEKDAVNSTEFDLNIPKIATITTILAFFVAQVQTYLNPALLQNNTGKTVNEIFFHLSVVCLIVFLLLCISLKAKVLTKITSWILLIQATVLSIIATNSDWTYITNWGLTHKRLYGLALIAWVFGAIAIFGFKSIRNSHLTQSLVILVVVVFGVTNLINLDYLIYQNPPRESTGIEKNYISAMSLDSGSLYAEYTKQLPTVELAQKQNGFQNDCAEPSWFITNTSQIRYLQQKYSKSQVLSWNWAEYTNWQQIKDTKLPEDMNPYYQPQGGYDYQNNSQQGYQNCYKRVYSSWED